MKTFRVSISLEELSTLDGRGMYGYFEHEWRQREFDSLEEAKEFFLSLVKGQMFNSKETGHATT